MDKERLEQAIAYLEHEIEIREQQLSTPKLTGMGSGLPPQGDFANVPPSAISRLRWHVRNIRTYL